MRFYYFFCYLEQCYVFDCVIPKLGKLFDRAKENGYRITLILLDKHRGL